MLSLTLMVCLASATPPAQPTPLPDGAAAAEDLITKRYDLSAITQLDYNLPPSLELLPLQLVPYESPGVPEEEEGWIGADEIAELITETVAPDEWESVGRTVESQDAALLVTAPAAIQAQVGTFLASLTRLLNMPFQVTIDLYEAEMIRGPEPVMNRARARSWLEDGVKDGRLLPHGRIKINVRPGQWVERSLTRELSYVSDWDVEIAQKAAIGDPVIGMLTLGSRILLHAGRTRAGTRLTLGLIQADLDGPIRERRLQGASRIVGESGVQESLALGTVQLPSVRFASLVTSFRPREETVTFVQIAPSALTNGLPLLAALQVSGGPPPIARIGRLSAFDTSMVTPDGIELNGGTGNRLRIPVATSSDFTDVEGAWWKACLTPRSESEDEICDVIDERLELESSRRLGPYFLFPSSRQAEVEKVLEMWTAPWHANSALEVTIVSSEPDPESGTTAEPVRVMLPLLPGTDAVAFFGTQRAGVTDWDVDVANESMVANPRVSNPLDGGFVRARLSSLSDREIVLDLSAMLVLLEEDRPPLDLGQDVVGHMDQPRGSSGTLSERAILRLDEAGRSEPVSLGTILVRDGVSYTIQARIAASW